MTDWKGYLLFPGLWLALLAFIGAGSYLDLTTSHDLLGLVIGVLGVVVFALMLLIGIVVWALSKE